MENVSIEEMKKRYYHNPEEYPLLRQQTHKLMRDGRMTSEVIPINENLIHYVQDTALLISIIDGTVAIDGNPGGGIPYDHVVYLDKSARPVSWLVNLFWDEFAAKNSSGVSVKRPKHSYINIDRSPWFRNVGISVSDDGRQKDNGELATYGDFLNHIQNLTPRHLSEIRALYIPDGIEKEDADWINQQDTILTGKRVLIIDEVSRTGSTLNIATCLFQKAFPDAHSIEGSYFWHPSEPILMMGNEKVLTSLPVWYDPNTLTGRGIGSLDPDYYNNKYEYFRKEAEKGKKVNLRKLHTYAYSSGVFSTPLLTEDGSLWDLSEEKKTRELMADLKKLYTQYKEHRIFFEPPMEWADVDYDFFEKKITEQGVLMMPEFATSEERTELQKNPLYYPNWKKWIKESAII